MATQKKPQSAKPAAAKKDSEIALRKNHEISLHAEGISIEDDAGQGFENADKDSFAIPFMRILQSGSPQCKKSMAEFIKGAEEGDFYNTVTKEVFPGGEGINIVQVHFDRKFTEWAPNRGGFRGEHLPSDPLLQKAVKKVNDEGKENLTLPGGNTISDTRYHFCLHIKDDGNCMPVLICMASSGLKPSKRLMTELNSVKLKKADGRTFTPPAFLNRIHLGSVAESNDKGDWFNYNPTLNGFLDISDPSDVEVYLAAKAFRDNITAGKATVSHSDDETGGPEKF
jgi:hypothetical protein